MITEQAIVTACHDGRVELQLQRQSVCGNCELSQGCGTGALGRLLGRRQKPLILDNTQSLKTGDKVVLEISERTLVKLSLVIYGFPLAGMILSGMLAFLLFPANEAVVLFASTAGFFGGFKFASWLVKSAVEPQITSAIVNIRVNSGVDSGS